MSDNINYLEILSVEDLLGKEFSIPSYQRGYRWKPAQIKQLLDDVFEFNPTFNEPFYFLQTIVVKKDGEKFKLVDGQQRWTTINLILNQSEKNAISLVNEKLSISNDTSINNHYKTEALKVITTWFDEKLQGEVAQKTFLEKLQNSCKLLVYHVKGDECEEVVFSRLNSGKISATDSELIKCILLTNQRDEPIETTKARFQEWDDIERALNDEQFYSFITTSNTWKREDRMTVLICYAGFNANNESGEVFPFLAKIQEALNGAKESKITIWKKIYSTFYTLQAWYNDPIKYHQFGYLVHKKGANVSTLNGINLSNIEIPNEFESLEYSENNYDIHNALLLFNVAYCANRVGLRYNFYQHNQVSTWSLEHIVARNQAKLSESEFEQLCKYACKESSPTYADYEKFVSESEDAEEFLKKHFNEELFDEDHSVGNLALLSRDQNSSLNNSTYMGKRKKLIEKELTGEWVPPATMAVFSKALLGMNSDQLVYFSAEDKVKYLEAIKCEINKFLGKGDK